MSLRILAMCITVTLSACASVAQDDLPAVIIDSSESARTEISKAVGKALGTTDVLIADDALTRESSLFVERRAARDATGQRLSGRDYDRPERFDLVRQGGKCVLVHASKHERYELNNVRCETRP